MNYCLYLFIFLLHGDCLFISFTWGVQQSLLNVGNVPGTWVDAEGGQAA